MAVQRVALRPGFDVSRIPNQSVATLINCFSELQDGKGAFPIVGLPGPMLFAQIAAPVRGLYVAPDGKLYAVGGPNLYRIDADGTPHVLGAISGTGSVEMDSNRSQIIIVANPRAFVWDFSVNSFSEVISGDWPGASTVAVISGFAIYGVPGADRFYISAINDARTINLLDFATAESLPDVLLAVRVVQGEPWFLGTQSVESWPLTGAANFPFQRSALNQDVGCVARDTARNFGNGLVWLGRERAAGGLSVYSAVNSYTPERISTHGVERLLERSAFPERAFAYVWRVEGHHFYVLTCDAGTVCYDESTQAWHQQASGVWPLDGAPPAAGWLNSCFFGNTTVMGDGRGRLVKLSFDVNADLDGELLREIVTAPMGSVGKQVQIHAIELELEGGLGGLVLDPAVLMSVSRDGGHTYDASRRSSTGLIGNYRTRVRWNRLGRARDFVARFRMSDAAPWKITGAWADVEELQQP